MNLRVRGQLDDAKRLVRRRLRAGWEVWVTTTGTQWARLQRRDDNERLETSPITPPEGVVLDEVLLEESRR